MHNRFSKSKFQLQRKRDFENVIDVDPTLPGLYWISGDAVVNADGVIIEGDDSGPDGTAIGMTQGQFSVAQNGKISGTMAFEGNLNVQLVDGAVDERETFVVFVYTNSKNGLSFDIALKKGGEYQPSDLAGNWTFYNLLMDPDWYRQNFFD